MISSPSLADSSVPRRRFLVIHNPVAGGRRVRRLRAVIETLERRHGAEVTVRATTGRGDAEAIARGVTRESADAVVVAGGDGTINEALNGLAAGHADVPLGLVPLGTANVLANELGLSGDPAGIAEVLVNGAARGVHLGLANGRCFGMMVGAGLDAWVVERVNPRLKRMIGKGAYVIETLAQMIQRETRGYRVTVGDRSWDVASVIVAHGRFYGGRFVCAPDASLFEPRLHVCLFPRLGRWNALRYVWGVTAGRLKHFPDFQIVAADRVTITGADGEPVQGDGDIITRLPVEITLASRPLPMLVPGG